MRRILAAVLSSSCVACAALAGPSIGVYFDEAGTQRTAELQAFTPMDFWILSFGAGEMAGWEAHVSFYTDPRFVILGGELNPPDAINIGTHHDNYVVGFSLGGTVCIDTGAGFHKLVRCRIEYVGGDSAPRDVAICLTGAVPSSFQAQPGYVDCANNLIPFDSAENGCTAGSYPDGCAILNPTSCPVALSESSVGAVRGRF